MQYLLVHPNAIAAQIGGMLSDIPRASLYHHLNKLLQVGAVYIAEERRVRGRVEKVHAPNENFSSEKMKQQPGNEFLQKQSGAYFLSMMGEFERYFQNVDAKPEKDCIMFRSAALFLTEIERDHLIKDIGAAFDKVLENCPNGERRLYRIGITSLPLVGGSDDQTEKRRQRHVEN